MKKLTSFVFFSVLLMSCNSQVLDITPDKTYPLPSERVQATENTTYFIHPVDGSDDNIGTSLKSPWKSFRNVNQLRLTNGNSIKILAPGVFKESIYLIGQARSASPINVEFAPGTYDFFPEGAFKSKFNISNTNDAPDSLKSVAFYFQDCENINVKGNGAEIVFRGKTIETSLNNCTNISIQDLSFDYKRPTVSELKVVKVNDRYVDVVIHQDSQYKIKDSTLIWVGEGWKHNVQNYWQEFDSISQKLIRKSFQMNALRFSEIGNNKVRIHFDKNPGFVLDFIYQNRNTFRDCVGIFMQHSKNILWKNVNIYFMHGMGIVSQFCENITIDSLVVKPKENSGRTCAAWADILHFSSCKGKILITNSYLSASNDDALNVHGTHLRIVEKISEKVIKVKFMHPQTFGFKAFFEGDRIEIIGTKSLLPYHSNVIEKVTQLNKREFEIRLNKRLLAVELNDVIENITWTPELTIRNTKIANNPVRGILVTTRRKIVIENNEFYKTGMSGILIADDAASWYESGYVRDVTIRNNTFVECGSPVINIHPENSEVQMENPVHKNIQILDNIFILGNSAILSAKSTENIKLQRNTIETNKNTTIEDLIRLQACRNVDISENKLKK